MGYHLTTGTEPSSRAQSLVDPKTHTPGPQVQERGLRSYNPTLGRWVSRDPIGEKGGLNLYCLLANAPTIRVDGHGLADSTGGCCCKQKDLDALLAQEPFASQIAALKKKKNKNGEPCLVNIVCGKSAGGGSYAAPPSATITLCSKVDASLLTHELTHANQCTGAGCSGPYPTRGQCSADLCDEIEAYIAGDKGTGMACDKTSILYDKDKCINRAWGSVVISCPGCRTYSTGSIDSPSPTFSVTCPGL